MGTPPIREMLEAMMVEVGSGGGEGAVWSCSRGWLYVCGSACA